MLEGRRDPSAEWWRKAVVVPARRAWVVVAARLRRKKHDDRGLLVKLHDDIQTCAYQDVQVMWEILQRSETEKMAGAQPMPKATRAFVWLAPRRRHHTIDLLQRPRS
uniref:Uncharacterized protein n=1 Tax=Avena sativa TaxID=4498 RepID=A0ACD5UF81_AVESA